MSDMPPTGNVQPPAKSGSKIWVFAGIGCLALLLVCGGGIGLIGYLGYDLFKDASEKVAAIQTSIESDTTVQEELGTPLQVAMKDYQQENQQIKISGTVSGPKGEGTFEAAMTATESGFQIDSVIVKANGKTIPIATDLQLGSDDELDLGINTGE